MSWVRATKVASAPKRQADRVEGRVEGAEGGGLGDLRHLGGGRVLALGQPVDLVVEHQDVDPHVAAQRVDEMVPADGQRVAVARDHPHVEIGPARRQPGGDRRGPPVDGVQAVGVHVVRETGGTPDAREEHGALPAHAEVGHHHLHRGEDGVVAAPGAPAHLLVTAPVLAGRHRDGCGRHDFPPRMVVMAASISITRNGTPCILLRDLASTRNSARRIRLSCPMLTSGTRIWL